MKSKFLLLISLLFFGILSNVYAASYWVIQKDTQRILHIQRDADNIAIVDAYTVIDPQADYIVNPKDNTCWVTSAFQGQVMRYGKAKPVVVSSFGAPVSLALDIKRQILWIADGALNQIVKMKVDGTVEKRVQFSKPSRSIASRADGGLWIATNQELIVLSSDGEIIKKFDRKAKYLSSVPGKNSVWLANPVDNYIMHLDDDGNILAEGRLKTIYGLMAIQDGGCVILGRENAFRLDAEGELIGTMSGLDHPSNIIYQPEDESIWILQSQGRQLVQLPKEPGQEQITVIAELGSDSMKVEPAVEIRWIAEARKPGSQKPEKPEEEKPSVPPAKIEKPEKVKPEKVEATKPKVEPEKEKPAMKPEVMPKPTVVPAPPTSALLSEPPKFKDGGVLLVKLYEELSSKRLKNAPQAIVRRYVWNFADETFTLLLGLSVEAYNKYTNSERAKWVEMLAEGVLTAKPIAEELRKVAEKHNWTAEQTANFVLLFVQSLPYAVDDVSTGIDEFPRYAIETLVAGGGDCEDTTILAGSIFLALGYDLVALNPKGHLALGIKGIFQGFYIEHNRIRYYYSETTGTGWKIGDIPEKFIKVPITIYEIPRQNQSNKKEVYK
jgi:hypothetical protein